MKEIKVSVIIPVYNTRLYLQECVDSILEQSLDSFEIIIVDDGSTDGSIELIREYERNHANIYVICQSNRKLGAARNTGLKKARGEYVYFFDSDDVLEKNALEYCYNEASTRNLDMIVFEADIFGDIKGRDKNQYLFHKRIKEIPLYASGTEFAKKYYNIVSLLNIPFTLYSRKFLQNNNLYFLENTFYEDVEFYHKVLQYNPSIMVVDKIFYHRRYRNNSIMTSRVNEISILNKINIYYSVFDQSTEEMKKLYNMIAVHGIRKVVQEVTKHNIQISEKNIERIISIVESVCLQDGTMSSFLDIQYCYFILNDLFNARIYSDEIYDLVFDYLKIVKSQLRLYDRNIKLGIYGRGDDCTAFLDLIKRFFGEFKCQIYYIQTDPTSSKNDSNVLCVKNIDSLQADIIFVGSYYYEDEILENLHKDMKRNCKVFTIKSDFKYYNDI